MRSQTTHTSSGSSGAVVAIAIALAAIVASAPVAGADSGSGVWNPVKSKMRHGQAVYAKRVDTADAATYCAIASMPGTDFTWTDMVSSGLDFSYAWTMWASPCATEVARIRGAEIFYSERPSFLNGALPRSPEPRELVTKEVQHATDGGAMVLIINVDDAAQARQVVKKAYYPPIGTRAFGRGQFDTVYPASTTGGDYVGSYNDNLVVIAIISTVAGVSQASTIASISGIHALFLDTMNLESESGYAQSSPDFSRLSDAVVKAAQGSRKYLCVANRADSPQSLRCTGQGLRP